MNDVDRQRLRKAEMLTAFSEKRKHHWVTMILTVCLGQFGAQRIYLGHYKLAAAIFILFLSGMYGVITGQAPWIPFIYMMIWLLEVLLATNNTDKENDEIRSQLQKEYDLI